MPKKRVFISFDFEHDKDLPGNLVHQANLPDSPFAISDSSLTAPITGNWKREARDRIRKADLIIVICGENTHSAPGVEAEVTIAQQENKRYILLKGRRKKSCSKPRSARASDGMYPWRWSTLKSLIAGTE